MTVLPGDMVRLNDIRTPREECCVVGSEGSVVVHPDTLLSSTAVTNSIECTRK